MGWQTFEFGRICLDGEVVDLPTDRGRSIYTPSYQNQVSFYFDNCAKGRDGIGITWIKPDNLPILIANRVLLVNISWDNLDSLGFVQGRKVCLNGHYYYCRLPRVGTIEGEYSEWDKIISMTSEENSLLNWNRIYTIGEDISSHSPTQVVCRGNNSATHFEFLKKNSRCINFGFRPVLEPINDESQPVNKKVTLDDQDFILSQFLRMTDDVFCLKLKPEKGNPFKGIPDDSYLKMYTLLCDGVPVSQASTKQGVSYQYNGTLTLTDKFYGKDFLISWKISKEMEVAATAVFPGINSAALRQQSFL